MNKGKIESLTKTALDFIEKSNYNTIQSETDNSMAPIYAAQENYKAFLATFEKLKEVVETQMQFDHLSKELNEARFTMKQHRCAENISEFNKYEHKVELLEKEIENLKWK